MSNNRNLSTVCPVQQLSKYLSLGSVPQADITLATEGTVQQSTITFNSEGTKMKKATKEGYESEVSGRRGGQVRRGRG